jgi:peptide/nickel transport system permease protein
MKNAFKEMLRYPSAIIGLATVLCLVALAVYAMIAIPYNEAISQWRGGEDVWYQNPKLAPPFWFNYFTQQKQPISFVINEKTGDLQKTTDAGNVTLTYAFEFSADAPPQELALYFATTFKEKQPFVSISLFRPDGIEIHIADFGVDAKQTYRFSQNENLGDNPIRDLFMDAGKPVKGVYKLVIKGQTFEEASDINAEFVLHGGVYGWAGTDHQRRDLMLPMLWGAPIALAFGLIASLGVSILTMIIAATGAWYGGWVDALIQRITEVNIILPFLSILVMIGTFYSSSIWTILGATVLLSIFGGGIKGYRSIFIQLKEATYIEAARAYGASSWRIIFVYMIPRMIPLLIPGLVSSVPSFVFLEATLAVLGLGDPILPTWGKIIHDAEINGALYKGYYYWIMEPAVLLMATGLGFAMLGFALDRIFNPRLRDL